MLTLYPEISRAADDTEVSIGEEIDQACEEIHTACEGFGTDEQKLMEVLGNKTATERAKIALRFPQLYEKSLLKRVDGETTGDYGELLEMLSCPLEEAEARMIKKATDGAGANPWGIIPLLCGRSKEDLDVLKKTYFLLFGRDLGGVIESELNGDFKQFILYSLQNMREEFDESIHTDELAAEKAEEFYKAGRGKWGTDEDTFFRLICCTPPEFLKKIDEVYTEQYGHSMHTAVEKELGGNAEDAAMFALGMTLWPNDTMASVIEGSMSGAGTDEQALLQAIVRYEIVLRDVMDAYEAKYGKTLQERIQKETGGHFRFLLLTLLQSANMHL